MWLALIDGVELGVFTDNYFELNEWLEKHHQTINGKMVRITPEQTSKRKKSIIFAITLLKVIPP